MKFKKIMLVTFVLLVILTIGAASAADDAASDDLAVEDIDEVSVDSSQDDLAEDSGEVLASSDEETVGENDDFNITFYEDGAYDQYDDEDETPVIDIRAPEDTEFTIEVTAEGVSEFILKYDQDDLDEGIITILPYDFKELDAGTYDITVKILDEDENEVASQTGTITFNGMGSDDDEDPYDVFIADEFDINDDEEVVASVFCPEESTGSFIFKLYDNMEEYISNYTYNIREDDWDTEIEVTANDLGIDGAGNYYIRVFYNNEELDDGYVEAVDYTVFHAYCEEYPGLFYQDSVLDVFCPDGSTGIVTVSVRNEENEEICTSQKDVADADDEGMLHWTLDELNITSPDKFAIEVIHEGDEIDNFDMEVGTPFKIEDKSYIGEEDSFGDLVIITLPNNIINATIIVSIDEEDEFSFTLDDFVFEDDPGNDGSKPIWKDLLDEETIKEYVISNRNLEFDFEDGEYNVSVALMIEGRDVIFDAKEVQLITRYIVINENVTIEIYKGKYDLDGEGLVVDITKSNDDSEGYILITVADTDWKKEIPLGDIYISKYINADEFAEFEEGDYEITVAYYNENDVQVFNITATVNFYHGDDDDEEDDADDGVVILVVDGDDKEFDLNNPDDLNTPFAFVSVQNDIDGRIVIMVWSDEEGEEQQQFGIDLENITNTEDDPDNEGFTIYKLSLNDLGNYDDFIECGSFRLAFIGDMEGEIDSRKYDIDYDDEEGIVTFCESDEDEDEEIHGEGEKIEAEFSNANVLDNGVVVTIPKDELSDDVDNEFTVIIPQEDDEPIEITLKLDEILEGDNYVIRVSDLELPEFREGYDILMILQFYADGEEAYYAEWMDDEEPIHIYESPCIFNESSLLGDDDVITIQEIPEGVDEFTVTISKDGMDDIVKTFKFSELVEDEEEVWVSLKLADLGITETGEYEITVKYSDDLTYSGNLNVTNDVDIRTHELDDEGDLETFESVDELVANFRISESVTGYVKIYVNDTQVGGNINLADLPMGAVPPDDGRQIVLNDLKITESGRYKVKLELYSDADELLGDAEFDILVEVGENSVYVNEDAYPYGTEANDEVIGYTIGAPLSDGQYFNIYFNGTKAGVITSSGLEFNEEFTVPMFDVLLFKPGNYDVNVTFFDGETETDVTTGSFSINELALTSDKAVYIFEEDHVKISFNADSLDDDDRVEAYYVYEWGPVGREDERIFNPYYGKDLKDEGLYDDGVVSFDAAWTPDDRYTMDEGTTWIYVVYRHGDVRYGGFINVTIVEESEEYIFMTSGSNVNPSFDVNTPSNVTGKVIIKNGDIIIKEAILDVIAEYDDGDGRWHHDVNVDSSDLDEGEYTITVVYEDGDGNVIQSKDFDIVIGNPVPLGDPARIFIMWSDWPAFEKVEYDLDSTDMIHIYPGDDYSDSSDIRIVVKIGDKVYLDATLDELNLEPQLNDHDELYYTIGPAHFTEDIAPGHYDNVIAYYYSPKYNIVGGEDGMPTYANLFGDSSVTFDDIEYTYGDEGTTTMVIDGATVSLENITVDNHPEAQIGLQDNVITVSGLAAGNYILKVVTTPINEYYRSVEASANITVKSKPIIPVDPKLAIAPVSDVEEGTNVVITISALDNFTGSVKVLVGGVEVGVADVTAGSGTYGIAADNLVVGENTVKVVSEANENFTAGEANVTFNVIKKVVPPTPEPVSPNLNIAPVADVEEGTNVVITISALDNFTGSVKVLVGGVEVGVADVTAGSGTYGIAADNLVVGENTVKVVSEASENFTAGEANVTFTVTEKVVPPVGPIDPNLTISVDDIREGTDAVITITTNSTFSGNVKVQIGTDNHTVSVTNGTGSIPVSGLAVGNYTAVATFEATETFVASTKNATFKVNKAVVPDPETAISTDSTSSNPNPVYSINLGPDATGNFTVKVGDKEYTKELKGGAATIEVTDLPAGTYEAVISYSGDAKYAPISKTVNATVKAVTVIKATDVTTTYGTSKNIVITLTDANGKALAGKKVTVVLNGAKKELTTDAKGQVSYAVGANLAVKTYEVSFTFDGDANYTSSTGTAKVVVNKAKSKLTAKKKTFKVKKKSKKYTVTLKTDKGKALKKVKVTLTGKFKGKKIKITKKTNSKGKATFNLKKLTKKGKFKATVKFAGNKNYKAASKKVKITIK